MPTIKEIGDSSEDNSDTNPEKQLQLFVKQMLQSRLFIGNFQEKRYVDSLQSYRDVIVISNEETDLVRDLEVVKNRLYGFYGQDLWIGITGPDMVGAPAGNCLWVELPDEIFGSYWYKISKVRFRPNEVLLRLKVIRPVSTNIPASTDSFTTPKKTSKCNTDNADGENNENEQEDNPIKLLQRSLNESFISAKNSLCLFLTTVVTIRNTKEAIKFSSVLLAALLTGAVRFFEYLGDFTIKFMREASVFLKAASPIIIACINLIGKIIGGFYLLILGIWRDRKGPPPTYSSPYVNRNGNLHGYNTVYFRRALPMPPRDNYRSGVRITPLD
ncbi:hypothetical protein ILUMI_13180 [Ignelater luminosus]|uniref:Uncharacterized protein n=1 Tax=Ignelater luminosus TaxID=2038154 RepID=A0A8K0CSW7_IGNLU|nr:hypothetical protein ILUMI_13180 [Ignelater luminosus]